MPCAVSYQLHAWASTGSALVLDTGGMRQGDVAGLALLNLPYGWIGARRDADGLALVQFDQTVGRAATVPLSASRVWLRARCDFLTEKATFSYSTDGKAFTPVGGEFTNQLVTFQGVRYSLFHYNEGSAPGGHADFDRFTVDEPHPRGLMREVPTGRTITLASFGTEVPVEVDGATRFHVEDRGLGRVALRAGDRYVSVGPVGAGARVGFSAGPPGENKTFQWTENVYGDLNLLSLTSHRHLRVDLGSGDVFADSPGTQAGPQGRLLPRVAVRGAFAQRRPPMGVWGSVQGLTELRAAQSS